MILFSFFVNPQSEIKPVKWGHMWAFDRWWLFKFTADIMFTTMWRNVINVYAARAQAKWLDEINRYAMRVFVTLFEFSNLKCTVKRRIFLGELRIESCRQSDTKDCKVNFLSRFSHGRRKLRRWIIKSKCESLCQSLLYV